MVVCDREEISSINYYLNGMQMVNNPDITYIALDDRKYDPATVVSVINNYKQDFVIISYNIKDAKTIEELSGLYTKIDAILGAIYDNTTKNSYNIIVTSLYPMSFNIPNASGEVCNVIYNREPLIYIDNFITKKNYLLNEGSVSDIFKVCYKSLNKDYPGESLVVKKNLLYRIVFK